LAGFLGRSRSAPKLIEAGLRRQRFMSVLASNGLKRVYTFSPLLTPFLPDRLFLFLFCFLFLRLIHVLVLIRLVFLFVFVLLLCICISWSLFLRGQLWLLSL
jgi:hypothetical protein